MIACLCELKSCAFQKHLEEGRRGWPQNIVLPSYLNDIPNVLGTNKRFSSRCMSWSDAALNLTLKKKVNQGHLDCENNNEDLCSHWQNIDALGLHLSVLLIHKTGSESCASHFPHNVWDL